MEILRHPRLPYQMHCFGAFHRRSDRRINYGPIKIRTSIAHLHLMTLTPI